MTSQNLLTSISFVVNEKPPYKQTPADAAERKAQGQRREACQQEAKRVFAQYNVVSGTCIVSIHYWRGCGKADSANIIGGILDALEGIVFQNDNQATEILYVEQPTRGKDCYQVTVTELQGEKFRHGTNRN